MEESKKEVKYVGVGDRVKAVITDSVVMIGLIIGLTYFFDSFDNVPESAKMIAFAFVFFLYDPLFTTFFGGTLGHLGNGIRVRRESNTDEKILIHSAFIRFVVKGLLGWISLLVISKSEKKKAIHDSIAGSVVVYVE
jgi:uncharacterized RDD family membrane protein YckC